MQPAFHVCQKRNGMLHWKKLNLEKDGKLCMINLESTKWSQDLGQLCKNLLLTKVLLQAGQDIETSAICIAFTLVQA